LPIRRTPFSAIRCSRSGSSSREYYSSNLSWLLYQNQRRSQMTAFGFRKCGSKLGTMPGMAIAGFPNPQTVLLPSLPWRSLGLHSDSRYVLGKKKMCILMSKCQGIWSEAVSGDVSSLLISWKPASTRIWRKGSRFKPVRSQPKIVAKASEKFRTTLQPRLKFSASWRKPGGSGTG